MAWKWIPDIEPRYRVLFVPMLAGFLLFGLNVTVIGAVLPKAIREFHWSYTTTGAVVCASSVSYFISTFLCGMLIRRIGAKPVIVGGLVLQAAGLALFGATPSAVWNAVLNLSIGFGNGATEVVINYGAVRMERNGQSRLMNLLHAAFPVGAILSPFAVEALLAVGSTWQMAFRLIALASGLIAAVMLLLPFSRLKRPDGGPGDEARTGDLLRHPLLILAFLILLVYVGAEIGVSTWVAEYYVTVLRTPAWVGAFMVSVFWAGLLIGRVGVSAFYHGTSQAGLLGVLAALATAALLAAVLAGGPWSAGVGFFLAGVGYSAIYPAVMALVGKHFPTGQAVAVGVAGTGGGIGALVFPFLMAALADQVGIRWGFFSYVALNVVMAGLIAAAIVQVRKQTRRPARGGGALAKDADGG